MAVVARHIHASEILYRSQNYIESIPLSILAIEESYKIDVFKKQLKLKQGISKDRWKKISRTDAAHRIKLAGIYTEAKAEIKDTMSKETYDKFAAIHERLYGKKAKPYEVAARPDGIGGDRLEALNEVKKDCFYVDWDDTRSDWVSFHLLTSVDEQKAIATIELHMAKMMLAGAMIWLKYPVQAVSLSKSLKKTKQ